VNIFAIFLSQKYFLFLLCTTAAITRGRNCAISVRRSGTNVVQSLHAFNCFAHTGTNVLLLFIKLFFSFKHLLPPPLHSSSLFLCIRKKRIVNAGTQLTLNLRKMELVNLAGSHRTKWSCHRILTHLGGKSGFSFNNLVMKFRHG